MYKKNQKALRNILTMCQKEPYNQTSLRNEYITQKKSVMAGKN